MHTNQNDESEDSASASPRLWAKSSGVALTSRPPQSDAATWTEDFWDIYTGYTLHAQQAGFDPKGYDKFVIFKIMVFFV